MTRFLLMAVVLVSFSASAQLQTDEKTKKAPVQEFSFEEELLTGDVKTPEISEVNVRATAKFSNLIRVRTSFAEKVMASESDIP